MVVVIRVVVTGSGICSNVVVGGTVVGGTVVTVVVAVADVVLAVVVVVVVVAATDATDGAGFFSVSLSTELPMIASTPTTATPPPAIHGHTLRFFGGSGRAHGSGEFGGV
ncbi:hypothetical protein [Antrihabitans stalagmiti]|uniref:hypothetical protein n=1 Tax=Antrihabitans stalagmiti TaxID=2799499 RepID=UPI001F40FA83|nr:hypothetical protein [Antrihabitans stalagmiti]